MENTPVPLIILLDHIGVAVHDAAEMAEFFEKVLGLATDAPEQVGMHRVRFVETGDSTIELVEPVSADSPVAKFLGARRSGLHHICLRVPDIDAALALLKARGVRLIDEVPCAGAHGSRIAFIHPSSACGLLIELKQVPL